MPISHVIGNQGTKAEMASSRRTAEYLDHRQSYSASDFLIGVIRPQIQALPV